VRASWAVAFGCVVRTLASLERAAVRMVLWGVLALLAAGPACKRSHASTSHEAPQPSVVVRQDTDGLLLTWIDDKGDFHVETRVADVPLTGRDTVRVVDPSKEEAERGDVVVVVDLREARPDGTFPVRSMTRTSFESIAVARREAKGPTMASAGPNASGAPASSRAPTDPAVQGTVVIYGASWCSACHDAARYLRRKGIPYVEKDVEADASAAREMQQKLARNGLHGGSIPVIDVRGKVMVGFNPAEIDAALGTAL